MSARGWFYLTLAVLLLASLGVGGLFWVQNSLRTTQLSLNLGFAAWHLARPVPVVGLIGGSFAAGFLLAALPLGLRSMSASRRVRALEVELELARPRRGTGSEANKPEGDGWR